MGTAGRLPRLLPSSLLITMYLKESNYFSTFHLNFDCFGTRTVKTGIFQHRTDERISNLKRPPFCKHLKASKIADQSVKVFEAFALSNFRFWYQKHINFEVQNLSSNIRVKKLYRVEILEPRNSFLLKIVLGHTLTILLLLPVLTNGRNFAISCYPKKRGKPEKSYEFDFKGGQQLTSHQGGAGQENGIVFASLNQTIGTLI